MNYLRDLVPINFLEEKERFLSDHTYNPQFVYKKKIHPKYLTKYGLPKPELVELATHLVEEAYSHRNEQDLQMLKGPLLTKDEAHQIITDFLRAYQLANRFSIVWSSSFLVRTTITADTLKLRLPCTYRTQSLIGVLYHEVGTHAIRRINYEQQPWFKSKKKYGFSEYLFTEEGLASLHRLIPHSFKSLHTVASRYLMAEKAQKLSFAELFSYVRTYVPDPMHAWLVTYRQKRGLEDTSQPGGFTKDLVYFDGSVQVWKWLRDHDFNPEPLYWGKIAIEDIDKAHTLNPDFQPMLPKFYTDDREAYAKTLQEIGSVNMLDKLKVR